MTPGALRDAIQDLNPWQGARPVDLLGHSHGGAEASLTAARYPAWVRSMVLLGTPAYGGARAESFQYARRAETAVARAPAAPEAQGDTYPRWTTRASAASSRRRPPLWVGPMTDARGLAVGTGRVAREHVARLLRCRRCGAGRG